MKIQVKLLKVSGQAAVVSYWDNGIGMMQAKIISINTLPQGLQIGKQDEVDEDILYNGTEYGIEWHLLLDSSKVLPLYTKAMRNRGLWTIQDVLQNPAKVIAAVIAASAAVCVQLRAAAQEL